MPFLVGIGGGCAWLEEYGDCDGDYLGYVEVSEYVAGCYYASGPVGCVGADYACAV